MVTSTTTTTSAVSRIPTGAYPIVYSNPYKYWWLRSPVTAWGGDAYYVVPSGGVNYSGHIIVDDSYGRESPDTSGSFVAYYVVPSGDVYYDGHAYLSSYGKDEAALMHQIYPKLLVVKIAVDGIRRPHRCVLCQPRW